jgi:hypothetical protein
VTAPDPAVLEAAVRKAAVTLANNSVLPTWMQLPALGRDMTPIAEIAVGAAYPLIAAAVEARTADAIADKIAERLSMPSASRARPSLQYGLGLLASVDIARSYRSAAPEETYPRDPLEGVPYDDEIVCCASGSCEVCKR